MQSGGMAEVAQEPGRAKRKPGARRLQILQTLAGMLEDPRGERVTTAALAARMQVSEAALYRHFASKAQMFEGLIEFIESTIFGLINQIGTRDEDGLRQLRATVTMLIGYLLIGVELIAETIENPFGHTIDDLSLNDICKAIENSVGETLPARES